MKSRKNIFLLLVGMLLAMMLVACGGTADEAAPEADAGPMIFTWAEAVDPFDIDPRTSYDGQGLPVLGQAYETLTHFNPPGSSEEISPELALSWEAMKMQLNGPLFCAKM